MNDGIRAAREHNTLALIHRRLSNENICDIFLALASLDTPSLVNPQGWFLQVNCVCHFWRELAVHCPELWARSAGSFPSRRMTDIVILRARTVPLSFDGHYEDHEGSGYVLTDYQLSLIETHVTRLRSLVHETYTDWSELFYCLKTFPKLTTAGIWDDSGPDMWHDPIDAPLLRSLYLNNALIPFSAPTLRHLRIDMDNIHWRSSRDVYGPYEPMNEGCETVPRVFPTRELIAFLQRSPLLERLIVTNMPLLLSEHLPSASELHAQLSNLRVLHLGGKSEAMGDLWGRLRIPADTQIFIDAECTVTGVYEQGIDRGIAYQRMHLDLLMAVHEHLNSSLYNSLRLAMTPSYDLILQMWSSEVYNASGLELSTSLELAEPTTGPAFTFRLPVGTSELLRAVTFSDGDQPDSARHRNPFSYIEDPFLRYQNEMAKDFYDRTDKLLLYFSSQLSYIDLTDVPFVACESSRGVVGWYGGGSGYTSKPDESSVRSLFRSPDTSPPPQRNVVLNWAFIKRLLADKLLEDRLRDYLPDSVEGLTVVNFPCVSFPSWKRYDEAYNAEAWGILANVMQRYSRPGSGRTSSLTLAESSSEQSNMERSEEPEYEHTIHIAYEDAVRAVTEKGYRQVAPFVARFEDLRVHTL